MSFKNFVRIELYLAMHKPILITTLLEYETQKKDKPKKPKKKEKKEQKQGLKFLSVYDSFWSSCPPFHCNLHKNNPNLFKG